ncbi:hypothetical protein [Streptomyces sp. NPDC002855]|uniref:hypothetical protein n=1 Tax=Streptomyces sp. NPDC002855 TaxID=3154437 RepID=UPI003327F41A
MATQTLKAADLNTYLRDNLLELAPAKATTEGGYFVSTGVNTIAERVPETATVLTQESTTSTSYTNLATVGPSVTVTTGTRALVFTHCQLFNTTADTAVFASWAMTGATTRSAFDVTAISLDGPNCQVGDMDLLTDLTPGSTTFTMKYRVAAGTGFFLNRKIIVMPL